LEGDSSATKRLFFALWPNDALREDLRRLVYKPVRHSGGKPVPPGNYHITLKFLGGTDTETRNRLCTVADRIFFDPFQLRLDKLGFWRKPRILWLGAAEVPDALTRLAGDLDRVAEDCGFEPETRPYRPHVTLARKVSQPGGLALNRSLVWRAERFVLAASETRPEGARYRVLRAWPQL
jgi:2'-5' RNA ligase